MVRGGSDDVDVCWSFGALEFSSDPIDGALQISLQLSDVIRVR
jgi:hypothetical protein